MRARQEQKVSLVCNHDSNETVVLHYNYFNDVPLTNDIGATVMYS